MMMIWNGVKKSLVLKPNLTFKENQMSNFISDRISEGSTHQGLIAAAAACAVLFGGMGLTQVVLYGALAWGVWSMLKKD